jgi:phage terminase large subunit-like protein
LSLRDEALESFWVFCKEVLRMPAEEQPHLEMAEFISSRYSTKKLLLVPRDCWKTSLSSLAFPLWKVLRAYFVDGNPCHRVLVDSATVRLSKLCISAIESYCKNLSGLKEAFGTLYDRKGRSDEGFSLSFRIGVATGIKEPNFFPSGIGAEKTGLHFEDIIMDDIVTEQNYRSPTGRDKCYDHYVRIHSILEESMREGASTNLLIVGTRWHDDDIYGRIIKADKKALAEGGSALFTTMIRQVVDTETGELFFPSKLDHRVIELKKQALGNRFYGQYMNDPNQESAPFKPSWLKWVSLHDMPRLQSIRLTVDTALKIEETDHGDYTCIVAMGWDQFHNPWVTDVSMADNMTVGAFINEFFRIAVHRRVESAIIEADHQEALELLVRREMVKRGISLAIRWEKVPRNYGKVARWTEIQPYAERGGVHIAEEIPESIKIEVQDEWERAPVASHDDFMDALSLQFLYLPMEFERDGGRFPIGAATPEETEKEVRKAQTGSFTFGTLASSFPHIKALQPKGGDDEEPSYASEEDEIFAAMKDSLGAA